MSNPNKITLCNPTTFLKRPFPGPWFGNCEEFYKQGRTNPVRGTYAFVDQNTFVIDETDESKRFKFEADGIDPGVTRTYRVPNEDTEFVGTTVEQVLTNKNITGATNVVGATQFETPTTPVVINSTAPTNTNQVLVTTSLSNATWQDISAVSVSQKYTYSLLNNMAAAYSTNYITIAYFPWSQARYGTFLNGILILRTTIYDRLLDVQLLDVTNSTVIASQTNIASSGTVSILLGSIPATDASIYLQVRKDNNAGTNPIIEGANLEFDG